MPGCAGIPLSDFPLWATRTIQAVVNDDEARLIDYLAELKCGHDAYNALMILPTRAAQMVFAQVEARRPGKEVTFARPIFTDETEPAVRVALQLMTAALNKDTDTHTALAMTVAEPMNLAESHEDLVRTYEHFADVVSELLHVVRVTAAGGDAIRLIHPDGTTAS